MSSMAYPMCYTDRLEFVLNFALPPFSPPLPSGVQISKQYTHRTLDPINISDPVYSQGQSYICSGDTYYSKENGISLPEYEMT